MPMLDKIAIPPKRICPLFILIESSGGMSGLPIASINTEMEEVLRELTLMNGVNDDVEIQIAVLTYDDETRWLTRGLISPEHYVWNELQAGGLSSMGAAFKELEHALSVKHGFLERESNYSAPAFILVAKREPTDDCFSSMQILKKNNWYKVGVKIAISFGQTSEVILREFTADHDTVLNANEPDELIKMFRFATITSLRELTVLRGRIAGEGLYDRTNDVVDLLRSVFGNSAQTLQSVFFCPEDEW